MTGLAREPFHPTTFPNDAGYDELVLVADWLRDNLAPRGVGVVIWTSRPSPTPAGP